MARFRGLRELDEWTGNASVKGIRAKRKRCVIVDMVALFTESGAANCME